MQQATELEATPVRPVVDRGLTEARAIGHPLARARHLSAWALRLSVLDPHAAAELLPDLNDEPSAGTQLLLAVLNDRLERGDTDLEPHASQAVEQACKLGPDAMLHVLNTLSEAAIGIAERDRQAALELLRRLAPQARTLAAPKGHPEQHQALACALVGEALLALGDESGSDLLNHAEQLAETLPVRDPVVGFLAGVLAERSPERAAAMADSLQDAGARLDARVQVAAKLTEPERSRLYDAAEADAARIEHMHGPEVLVRMAHALAPVEPDRARRLFERALTAAEGNPPQLRCLQWTGVASAVAQTDRDWAGEIYRKAATAVDEEPDRVRQVTSLVVIADEMAESHPREAADLFSQAMELAVDLDALWEYAHVLELVFRADRSPYLDVSAARAVLERVLERLSDEDPRIPGVFGLPEAGRLMAQVDAERAVGVFTRWLAAAEASGDTEGMTSAALAIYRTDPEAGAAALERARESLTRRIDCPAMGEFCRAVAPVAPDMVLAVAPLIPDRRERAEATAAAALGLYEGDAEAALRLIDGLERPVDRSQALLALADQLLGTGDRAHPEPLLEDLP